MPNPNEEERRRVVAAGINIATKKLSDFLKPPEQSDFQLLQAKFKAIIMEVGTMAKNIADTQQNNGQEIDKEALFETTAKLMLDKMGKQFSYDELAQICAIVHAGMIVDQIV